jgi:hypothetical protein
MSAHDDPAKIRVSGDGAFVQHLPSAFLLCAGSGIGTIATGNCGDEAEVFSRSWCAARSEHSDEIV